MSVTVMEFRVDWATAALIGCRALKDAAQWYQENKQLRRRTLLLPDQDAVDCVEGADIDNLRQTLTQLSAEVAELQTELDAVRHSEFQTLEQNAKLCEVKLTDSVART